MYLVYFHKEDLLKHAILNQNLHSGTKKKTNMTVKGAVKEQQ